MTHADDASYMPPGPELFTGIGDHTLAETTPAGHIITDMDADIARLRPVFEQRRRDEEQAAAERAARVRAELTEIRQDRRRRGLRRGLAVAGLTAAGFGIMVPGGVADMVAGAGLAPHQVVMEHASGIEPSAAEAVGRTMDDLQSGNEQAIRERAEQFRRDHSDQFVAEEVEKETKQILETAETVADVKTAMKVYETFYRFTFDIRNTKTRQVSLDEARQASLAIVDGFSRLPRALRDETKLASITLQADLFRYKSVDGESVKVSIGGVCTTRPSNNLPISHDIELSAASPSYLYNFLHEFGHALPDNLTVLNEDNGRKDDSLVGFGDSFKNVILAKPTTVSNYGRTNHGENRAENFAATLMPSPIGIASPKEARRFTSERNSDLLLGLAKLEKKVPGYAAYVVALNEGLLRRNF